MAIPVETTAISRRDGAHARGDAAPHPVKSLPHVVAAPRVWLAALAALAGCDPWVVGDGVYREESRSVAPFTAVSVQDGIGVEVTAGITQRSLTVSGDENVLEHVKTTVKIVANSPTLVVEADVEHLEATLPLLVSATTPAIDSVTATGDSTVDVLGASAELFVVAAGDGAAVTLAGAGGDRIAVSLWGGKAGGAMLDARSYIVNGATVNLSGGSFAQLHADDEVSGSLSGESALENVGEGTCDGVTATGSSTVSCMNP